MSANRQATAAFCRDLSLAIPGLVPGWRVVEIARSDDVVCARVASPTGDLQTSPWVTFWPDALDLALVAHNVVSSDSVRKGLLSLSLYLDLLMRDEIEGSPVERAPAPPAFRPLRPPHADLVNLDDARQARRRTQTSLNE